MIGVNRQHTIHILCFCICFMSGLYAALSFAAQKPAFVSPEIEEVIEQAEQGEPHAQYFLGLLYQEGKLISEDKILGYVWLDMAARQDFKDAERLSEKAYYDLSNSARAVAKRLAEDYYSKYVMPYIPAFVININGDKINGSGTVSPDLPINMIFTHIDPAVTKVRMQDPKNPALYEDFELGRPYVITKHEKYMQAGRLSRSVFLALDDQNKVYNQIKLIFKPVGEQEDENSQ